MKASTIDTAPGTKNTTSNRIGKKFLPCALALLMLLTLLTTTLMPTEAFAALGDYDARDVAVINKLIASNGLKWTYNDPDSWPNPSIIQLDQYVRWNTDIPKRVTQLDITSMGITGDVSFDGLDELKVLLCMSNQLTSLDVTKNLALEVLGCKSNKLTSLDLSNNQDVWEFDCSNNYFTDIKNVYGKSLTIPAAVNGKGYVTGYDGGGWPPIGMGSIGSPNIGLANIGLASIGLARGAIPDPNNNVNGNVSLTAVADPGASFVEWKLSPSNIKLTKGTLKDSDISFELNQDITATPVFAIKTTPTPTAAPTARPTDTAPIPTEKPTALPTGKPTGNPGGTTSLAPKPTKIPAKDKDDNVISLNASQTVLYIRRGKTTRVPVAVYTKKPGKVKLKWTSGDQTIVKTRGSWLTGLKNGVTKVTATAPGGKKFVIKTYVISRLKPTVRISIKDAPKTMKVGTSAALRPKSYIARYTGPFGGVFRWKSSNPSVLKIDAAGKITALKKGKAKITLTGGRKAASVVITVK